MSDEDKAEMRSLLAESFADGVALFRSRAEEEAAKAKAAEGADGDKGTGAKKDDNSSGFSLTGFILGAN